MGGGRLHPSHDTTVSVNMESTNITWNKLDVSRAYTGWPDHIIIVDVIVVNSCVTHQVESSTST